MKNIHNTCVQYGKKKDRVDYVKGANIGGFVKIANAMLEISISNTMQRKAAVDGPKQAQLFNWEDTSIQIQNILSIF